MIGKFNPINIDIKNDYRYGQVAAVVDRSKVCKTILKLRKKWGIQSTYPKNKYIEWLEKLGRESRDSVFRKDIVDFRKGLGVDPAYDRVLTRAVVCNLVGDDDFKSAYLVPIADPRDSSPDSLKYAIIVTPDSRPKDVMAIFDQFISDVKYSRKRGKKLSYRYLRNLPTEVLSDTKKEIRKHRQWYWENRMGNGPLEIARNDGNRPDSIDVNTYKETVKWGIRSYKKLLRREF